MNSAIRGACSNSSLRFTFKDRGESGATLVTVTLSMVAIFGFAALSLDVGNVLREQRKENTATDAGAIAGVAKLPDKSAAIQEAVDLAGANGVTTNEIKNSGTIEIGNWSNSTFTANTAPFNAVRVPARRNVPMNFAGVVGMRSMSPAIHSVAALVPAGDAANPIPFGVTADQLVGKDVGYFMDLNDAGVGSGKQGKIDFGFQNTKAWSAAMTPSGCGCDISVGSIPTITGNAQVMQAFKDLGVGAIVTMPVVDQFDTSGNKAATIVGFVRVIITGFSSSGSNWSATIQFLQAIVGGQGGGSCPSPCAQARALVQ